jgi:hypothetical protein
MTEEQPHQQQQEERSPDEPIGQPPHVDTPTEGEHLSSPEPGHPAGETQPQEGVPEGIHEHPEDIGETPSDEEGADSVTESSPEGESDSA